MCVCLLQVWYGAVLRGDQSCIEVGIYSNIQDRVVINTVPELKSGFTANVEIGDYCSVGHGSILTSCVMEDFSFVGQGCIISEGLSYFGSAIYFIISIANFRGNYRVRVWVI